MQFSALSSSVPRSAARPSSTRMTCSSSGPSSPSRAGPRDVGVVGRRAPAVGGEREHLHHVRGALPVAQDLLDPDERDVHARQPGAQPDVALGLDEHERAGLGDEEVRAGDAHLGGEEAVAQLGARVGDEPLGVVGVEHLAREAAEQLGHLARGQVHRRGEDVRRAVAHELHDVLAEVGLHRLDAGLGERLVEADLLGEHRLRLDRAGRAAGGAQLLDDARGVAGGRGVVDDPAGRGDALLGLLDQLGQVGDRVGADGLRAIAPALPVDERLGPRAVAAPVARGAVQVDRDRGRGYVLRRVQDARHL